MGLRQKKHEQTEHAIVTAAYGLFEEQGYEETTVEQIAAASDVSPRTFYRYFESKDTILAINGFRTVDSALQQVGPDASISDLTRALSHAVERSLAHEYSQVAVRVIAEHPRLRSEFAAWRARWAEHLAEGLAAAAGRDSVSAPDRVRAITAMNITGVAVEQRLREGCEQPVSDLAEQLLSVVAADLRGSQDVASTQVP